MQSLSALVLPTILAQNFYLVLLSRSLWITVHSTFSTSTVVIRDLFVVFVVLIIIGLRRRSIVKSYIGEILKDAGVIIVILWGPFFVYNLFVIVPAEIQEKADRQTPRLDMPSIYPPETAFDLGPPSLQVSLSTQKGFTLNLQPAEVSLENKRQYTLTIENIRLQPAESVDLVVQFPYPVEAQRILLSKNVSSPVFAPNGTMNVTGAHIQINGCVASSFYRFRAKALGSRGKAEVVLVLNSIPGGRPVHVGPTFTFIDGKFAYNFQNRKIGLRYYARFELTGDKMVRVKQSRTRPPRLHLGAGSVVLPAPCIKAAWLRK